MTLCAVFLVLLAFGQAVSVRHRATAAADLAALAAADVAPRGQAVACARARQVAQANGARVVRCLLRSGVADLTAEVRWKAYASRVRARAGPPAAAR